MTKREITHGNTKTVIYYRMDKYLFLRKFFIVHC